MQDADRESLSAPIAMHGRQTDDVSTAVRSVFERRLLDGGLSAGLAVLNQRARFRFTGVYRVVPPYLHNVSLYDRENPTLNVSGAVCALSDTYCSIVHERGRSYLVEDAPGDASLCAHPARESVQSYAGVPIRLPGGRVLGTLCHFDGRPRILPLGELKLLEEVAPLLVSWLALPATQQS